MLVLTQQAVAAVRQPLALSDVEAQVVPLVGRWVLVQVQQDHEADVPSHRHRHVGLPHNGDGQDAAVHGRRRVAGQHHPVQPVQYHLLGRHLDVGPSGPVHHDGDGAEVGALLLVAAGWRRGTDELTVHCQTWRQVIESPSTLVLYNNHIFEVWTKQDICGLHLGLLEAQITHFLLFL